MYNEEITPVESDNQRQSKALSTPKFIRDPSRHRHRDRPNEDQADFVPEGTLRGI